MIRSIIFVLFYLLLLGTTSFRVKFKDGLKIVLIGWPEKIWGKQSEDI